MQMSKLVKGLMLALPIIAVTACSSHKNDAANTTVVVDERTSTATTLDQLQQQNTVYFDFDRYVIKPEYTALLDAHAAYLRANPSSSVIIQGHTDERGTPEYNIALGERRANAVKAYLQGRGVLANQIGIVSYGKEKPAVLGHDEYAHSQNRRAIIVY